MLKRLGMPAVAAAVLLAGPRAAAIDEHAPAIEPARQLVTPTPGMVIDRSMRLAPGTYRLPASGDAPAIRIRGDNIAVDFTGVTIEGGEPFADPDRYTGTGLLIEDARGVTITGATIRGYKVAVLARRAPGLHLTGSTLSYNWKPRLWSGIERESLVDWLSYHDNERDEWLRYGAAIYLSECDGAEIDNNTAVQGQNGLLVTRSSKLRVWNNTFSWNSGLGIGMYRTTESVIAHNRLDWDVRGYSHGFYNRGQDSSALLMYEQTSHNQVFGNSATHGGDGLFLWAGQSTMDSGQGGANDNLFQDNDFSHAVANGIEATFSRNRFVGNRIDECWHGVWGGYSYDSEFSLNTFAANTEAIAIEHGQNIVIADNVFARDETAIRLWANATQDPNWGYPKTRDTRSRDYVIRNNRFDGNKTGLNITRTAGVRATGNSFTSVGVPLQAGVDVRDLMFEPPTDARGEMVELAPVSTDSRLMNAKLADGARRGRSTIIVDEWGPYDYKSPKLWPAGKPTERPLKLRVLGPDGKWRLKSARGATVSPASGVVPGELSVRPAARGADFTVTLEYVGGEITTPRGQVHAAGTPVAFSYASFEPAAGWDVRWWTFDAASDPVKAPDAFAARLLGAPVRRESLARLELLSSRALSTGLPNDRVAMRADADVQLPAGSYDLVVISDDGVRVSVDGKRVIDRWNVHESTVDRARLGGGRHHIRIEYFEATGWAELQVRFVPAR